MPGSGSSASSSHTQLSCKELNVLTSKLLADVTWFLWSMWKACRCTEAELQWVILTFKKIGINPLALTSQHHFSFYLSTTYQRATLSKSKMLAKKRKSKFRKWWLSQRYRLGRCVPSSSLQKKQNQCQRPWPGWPIVAQLFTLVSYASTCRYQLSICGIQFLFT